MKKITSTILLLTILFSCKTNIKKDFKNESIPNDIKTTVSELNTKIIRSIKSNETKEIANILSEKLISKLGNTQIDSIFSLINPILKNETLKEKDSYYVINTNSNISNTIFSGLNEKTDYSLTYRALSEKMFISLFETTSLNDNVLLTLIYGLDKNNDWKLNIFHLGQHEIFNKNFVDFYNNSVQELNNKNLINAGNNIFAGKKVMKPANEYFGYLIENKFIKLEQEIISKINESYKFPITLDYIETTPEIFHLSPLQTGEDFSTMIRYKSKIDLKDINSLKKENLVIQENIESIFKGITNNKYVIYRAYSEYPSDKGKQYDYYGFVQEN